MLPRTKIFENINQNGMDPSKYEATIRDNSIIWRFPFFYEYSVWFVIAQDIGVVYNAGIIFGV